MNRTRYIPALNEMPQLIAPPRARCV
jgi:hypothetical protein